MASVASMIPQKFLAKSNKRIASPSPPKMSQRSLSDPSQEEYPWSDQEEGLLTLWSDRALCYRLLHEAAYKDKSKTLLWFTIPVIILSTVTGTANFGMQSLVPSDYLTIAQSVIGALNLLAGLMTTIQNFLRLSERTEGHRQAFIGWGQLHRSIYTDLKLERGKRRSARETLQRFRVEYDRLIAVSPALPRKIIQDVSNSLKHHVNLILPEECDNLLHTEAYMDQLLAEHTTRRMLQENLPPQPMPIDLLPSPTLSRAISLTPNAVSALTKEPVQNPLYRQKRSGPPSLLMSGRATPVPSAPPLLLDDSRKGSSGRLAEDVGNRHLASDLGSTVTTATFASEEHKVDIDNTAQESDANNPRNHV